ncbi:MAG: HlyD family efflux transporter periplasmic adaptor subunit [Verrucomicrobia bacterium]|nr:HlyD family efflux transporter periplasmic adaptor subunit [Verrucomicrobiota bacterium]
MNPATTTSHHSGHTVASAMPMLDQRAHLPVLEMTKCPNRLRWFSRLLFGAFLGLILGLVFLPWQQFVQGAGSVVAYDPLDRSITVEAPLPGRVRRAYVVEGQAVKKGEVLFELADNDPNLLANLQIQREAANSRRDAANQRVGSLAAQLTELERALPLAVEAAQTRLDAAKFASTTAQLHYERIKSLFENERGLASQRDFELATLERDRASAELVRAEAELKRASVDMRTMLNGVLAQRDSAKADVAAAEQSLTTMDIQISQNQMQRVTAPRDGIVFRVQATEGTYLRAGSPLCTVIPETDNRMVELLLDGNDMPLVQAREMDEQGKVTQPGSPVRLQFEGWPAIQFIGWPSAAIGTFGGEVVLVDPTDNGKGKFRVLVAEKPDVIGRGTGEPRVINWPSSRWLRQGVRANGWVLLQRVPLWYEVWRQLNGFPPALTDEALGETGAKK